MTKEEIVNLANRCSRKIWEICMEEPGFSTNDCPEGANGLSDIVLNVILKEFPAIKECSSLPSNLDEAAEKYAKGEGLENALGGWEDMSDAFKAGAEWMTRQGISTESKISKLTDRAWVTPINEKQFMQDVCDNFVAGDKVIVQIRKK